MSGAESRGGGEEGFGFFFLTLSQRGGSTGKHPSGYAVLCLCVCVRARVVQSLPVCVVLAEAG